MNEPAYQTVHFGNHLTIDGYDGDFHALNDRDTVMKVLDELPNLLHMKKLQKPFLIAAAPNDKKDPGGWTGVVTIAESHISVHTFPARHFVSADVYTCTNDLNVEFILEYFKKNFLLKEIESNHIIRGTRYPAHNLSEPKQPHGFKEGDLYSL
jgi:S-adenosylmethionine decarboxylase